jgi:hypothetical protein
MSGRARTRSAKNTGQRKNLNTRDSDPKPKSKKSKRGTKLKGVPKEGLLGTLFEEVEEVEESLQFLNAKELKSYRSMSSCGSSESSATIYWEDKMIEFVVAEECDAIIDDLKVGRKGAAQNSNKAVRTACRRLFNEAALAFKIDITKAVSLKLKHLERYDSEEDARMAIIGAHRIVLAGITAVVLHDHDLRADNLDDLNSVVGELKVVVEVNGDLDCVRKSPEEGEGSKASELLKHIQSDPTNVEALRNLLAIATAAKNGSEAIDLTDDSNNDPPQQSPNPQSLH